MQTFILALHNIIRWLILLFALVTIFRSASGMGGKKPFTAGDKRWALFLLISVDIQLLLGLYLYFANGWFGMFQRADVMSNPDVRFFVMEHNVSMIIAIILIHIGYGAIKKSIADAAKFKRLFWYTLIALIVILVAIPWPFRAAAARGWFPTHF